MTRISPRAHAELAERNAALPPGGDERFIGYALMGMPFASGHYLAFRRFPASSVGPAYAAVWLFRPRTVGPFTRTPRRFSVVPGTSVPPSPRHSWPRSRRGGKDPSSSLWACPASCVGTWSSRKQERRRHSPPWRISCRAGGGVGPQCLPPWVGSWVLPFRPESCGLPGPRPTAKNSKPGPCASGRSRPARRRSTVAVRGCRIRCRNRRI